MSKPADNGEKLIASNPNRSNFFIDEVVEAGIVLTGTEIKSIRATSPNIRDAFVEVRSSGKKLEAWMLNMTIGHYSHGNIWNHEQTRKRKLLLHRRQIDKIYGSLIRDGMTVIPVRMYFKGGIVKCELGVGRGKKKGDRRQDVKERSAKREIDQVMKHERKGGR